MIVNINNQAWTCRAAKRDKDVITIYYGTYTAPDIENNIPPIENTCSISGKGVESAFVVDGEWEYDAYKDTMEDDINAMLIDQEYRLTLLELGVTE